MSVQELAVMILIAMAPAGSDGSSRSIAISHVPFSHADLCEAAQKSLHGQAQAAGITLITSCELTIGATRR